MARLTPIELGGLIGAGAGVQAAIAPEHLHEWTPLGASFVAAAGLLPAAVVALAVRICTTSIEAFGLIVALRPIISGGRR